MRKFSAQTATVSCRYSSGSMYVQFTFVPGSRTVCVTLCQCGSAKLGAGQFPYDMGTSWTSWSCELGDESRQNLLAMIATAGESERSILWLFLGLLFSRARQNLRSAPENGRHEMPPLLLSFFPALATLST